MAKYPDPPTLGEQPYQIPLADISFVGTGPFTCPGHLTHDNCFTNKVVTCAGNQCSWYGDPCASNGPFLLDGQCFDCSSYTDPDTQNPTPIAFSVPNTGVVATALQLNALRHSILEEYSNRRWILEGANRTTVVNFSETVGDLINASPNIANLGAMIQFMIDRGKIPYQDYDFVNDPDPNVRYDNLATGFQDTDYHTIGSPPSPSTTILSTETRELMGIVDDLRKACVCNNNCVCFGQCDCNWNCLCNY